MQIQLFGGKKRIAEVVICFKFSNFAYANTVTLEGKLSTLQLLFALNLVTLLMQIQSVTMRAGKTYSCYLL